MSNTYVQNTTDITAARNLLRRKINGANWSVPFRARASTALTAVGEFIVSSGKPGTMEVGVVMSRGTWGVELKSTLHEANTDGLPKLREQLSRLADEVKIDCQASRVCLTVHLWLTGKGPSF